MNRPTPLVGAERPSTHPHGGNARTIVFLNPGAQLGGGEQALLRVLGSLRTARPEWFLQLIVGEEGPLVEHASRMGVDVTVLPLPSALARLGDASLRDAASERRRVTSALRWASGGWAAVSYARRLRRVLSGAAPDLVHAFGLKMHLLAAMARPAGVPILWHVQDYVSPRRVVSRLVRVMSRRCAVVVTASRSVAEDLATVLSPGLQVMPIHNAVDVEGEFFPKGPVLDLDGLSNLPSPGPGTVRVGLVATMAFWKGHEVFLRALASLPSDGSVRGYVVGGPIYSTDTAQEDIGRLRRLAEGLGLGDRVGFTGFVAEPAAAMRMLDVVVHASTRPEPFGMAVAEAMSLGKAVVVSYAGGVTEITKPGVDSLAHAPGDVAGLAREMERAVADPDLRARLGAAARSAARRTFESGDMVQRILAAYASVGVAGEDRNPPC